MKNLYTLFFAFVFCLQGFAQTPQVMRHSDGDVFVYNLDNFEDAFDFAQDGDTIYLPGGTLPGFTVNKKVHVYGAGYYPGYVDVTQATQFSSNITLAVGSAGSMITGIQMLSDKFITLADSNMTISRCYLNSATTGINGLFFNNIVRGKSFSAGLGSQVLNNIIMLRESNFLFSVNFSANNSWLEMRMTG